MTPLRCVRCDRQVDDQSVEILYDLPYCAACAAESKRSIDAKKRSVRLEESEVVRERDVIEKELALISEKDIRHIIVTTTDAIEGKSIGEYRDVISIQEIRFERIPVQPADDAREHHSAGQVFRENIEISLLKLKKRAYLASADAVVGLKIESSVDYDREGGTTVIAMTQTNIFGTAVRLIDP